MDLAASGLGSTKMCRWSNAATSLMCSESSIPLPNTSPDMSPMPTTAKSSVWVSSPSSRKCRLTDSRAPRAVVPIFLWSYRRAAAGAHAAPPATQPYRDLVGGVGERGGALVRGDHEVRVVAVVPDHVAGRYHDPLDEVVGDVQQRLDEQLVAGHPFREVRVPLGHRGRLLEHEAALG